MLIIVGLLYSLHGYKLKSEKNNNQILVLETFMEPD